MKSVKLALKMSSLPVLMTIKSVEICTKATVAAINPVKNKIKG